MQLLTFSHGSSSEEREASMTTTLTSDLVHFCIASFRLFVHPSAIPYTLMVHLFVQSSDWHMSIVDYGFVLFFASKNRLHEHLHGISGATTAPTLSQLKACL